MKKLSKETTNNLATLRESVTEAWSEVSNAQDEFNRVLETLRDAVDAYNEGLSEAAESVREYMGERSEKWHESDAAERYEEWASELEGATLDDNDMQDVDVQEPDFPELPELG